MDALRSELSDFLTLYTGREACLEVWGPVFYSPCEAVDEITKCFWETLCTGWFQEGWADEPPGGGDSGSSDV